MAVFTRFLLVCALGGHLGSGRISRGDTYPGRLGTRGTSESAGKHIHVDHAQWMDLHQRVDHLQQVVHLQVVHLVQTLPQGKYLGYMGKSQWT